ncbi:MAG: hypothetical protein HN380_17455, partial [Victivallales bacterium]|nr:hypothetical protein [Victivallales bacterium]
MSPAAFAPGFHPFWFWNDRLSADEIRWQIQEMAQAGVRGFYIHSRQGLDQPYLSDAFMDLVEVAFDEARRHGMAPHLYDEYPYPSGVAGGEVVLGRPEFQATRLAQSSFDVDGGPLQRSLPPGYVLACTACPLTDDGPDWSQERDLRSAVGLVLPDESYNIGGLTVYNRKRYFASNPTPRLETELPPGRWRVFVSVQMRVTRHKYWDSYVDVLNPAAMQEFLRLTHERYAARFGERLAQEVPSIFVDETLPHWSALLPDAFRKAYGYDLLGKLSALQNGSHPDHVRVARDLRELVYELFCESFEKPVSQWCAAHGIRYAGEKESMRLAQLRYMDIPGCDPGHTKAGTQREDLLGQSPRRNARTTASAAFFYGKEGALCECYHSLGWSGTLQDARLIADNLIWAGIRYLVPHGLFYSTHALKKHDAPPTFFFQMPYWPLFRNLSDRTERLFGAFEGTHIDARILLVEPSAGLPTREQLADYEELQHALVAEHVDFLVCDRDILAEGETHDGVLRLHGLAVTTVIVPDMAAPEPELEDWLASFPGTALRREAYADATELARAAAAQDTPSLRLEAITGDATRVFSVTRTDGTRRVALLINNGATPVDLRLKADFPLAERPLQDNLPALLARDGNACRRTLAPFEAVLLVESEQPLAPPPPTAQIAFPTTCAVEPQTPNLARLNRWQLAILDEAGTPQQSETVDAVPLSNQLGQGGFHYAPNIREAFGQMPTLALPTLDLRYSCGFHYATNTPVELVMEPGSLLGDWSLRLNDSPAFTAADFRPTSTHVRGSLGLDLTPWLQAGVNQLAIHVTTNRLDGGLRNPLYLTGVFGVELAPLRLVDRPKGGHFEAYETNALPHFSGILDYTCEIFLEDLPDGDQILLELHLPCLCEEAIELSLNGNPAHALPWSPRRILVNRSELTPGSNQVRLRVYTNLIRAFEGQR